MQVQKKGRIFSHKPKKIYQTAKSKAEARKTHLIKSFFPSCYSAVISLVQ